MGLNNVLEDKNVFLETVNEISDEDLSDREKKVAFNILKQLASSNISVIEATSVLDFCKLAIQYSKVG